MMLFKQVLLPITQIAELVQNLQSSYLKSICYRGADADINVADQMMKQVRG